MQISILEQQKTQLVDSLSREKERARDLERDKENFGDTEKKLADENERLIRHLHQLELIVEKVNCEVRNIAAQTECSYIQSRKSRLHIDEFDYDSSDSSSTRNSGDFNSVDPAAHRKRKRKPIMRSVASGGFEYLDNIICYDRTCLRSVGIGTSIQTRDFGQVTSIKLQKEHLRVDRAVGNHTELRTVGCHVKPETREKRCGNSRPTTCDATTTPDLRLRQERGVTADIPLPNRLPPMPPKQPEVVKPPPPPKPEMVSIGVDSTPETTDAIIGPDTVSFNAQSTYVNWLSENSRSRRVQTVPPLQYSTSTSTENVLETTERVESGCDPIAEIILTKVPEKHACLSNLALCANPSPPLTDSLCSLDSHSATDLPVIPHDPRQEPRQLDECSVDGDNEIIYLFRSKTGDSIEDGSDGGKGELRTLRWKETCDVACGPDTDLKEQTIQMLQELMKEHPEEFHELIGNNPENPAESSLSLSSPDTTLESVISDVTEAETKTIPENDLPPDVVIERKAEFGAVDYPLMTDIEERYELPDGMMDHCIALERHLLENPNQPVELERSLKREWFNVSSKPNSSTQIVDDFVAAVTEAAKGACVPILNAFDANGNCALHYAVSHGNLAVVCCLVQSGYCDLNVYNKAGYTPVMLAALVDSSEKQDLSPLVKLFKKSDLNLHSKKEGQTALMLACGHGRRDTVRLLLMNGCAVDAQDEEGSTALMCAAEHGHTEIVKLILDDPNTNCTIEDNDGSTALDIAMEAGHRDIGVMLYAKMNFEE